VSVLVLRLCALKLIFKLISIADCVPSFELVPRRKYSERAIFTATVAVKIADWLFFYGDCCIKNSQSAMFTVTLAVKIASQLFLWLAVKCKYSLGLLKYCWSLTLNPKLELLITAGCLTQYLDRTHSADVVFIQRAKPVTAKGTGSHRVRVDGVAPPADGDSGRRRVNQ